MVNLEMNIPPPLYSKKSLRDWTLRILQSYSIKPLKKLSQNFIIDPRLVKDILNLTKDATKQIIEVGAGIGTITFHLSLYNYVIAIEYDKRLIEVLEDIISSKTDLTASLDIVNGDFLDTMQLEHFTGTIVSNVPYHIASYVIIKTLQSLAKDVILILQKELALRLIAKPGKKDYGRLTIIVNYIAEPKLLKTYPPSSFYPSPEVYNALIVLRRKRKWDETANKIEDLTRCLFSEKNKLAIRVIEKCLGKEADRQLRERLKKKRVRELELEEILYMVQRYC